MSAKKFTPMIVSGSSIILPGNAGGFNVCKCPDPEELANFIHDACNRDHAFDDVVKALQSALFVLEWAAQSHQDNADLMHEAQARLPGVRAALAKAGVK